MYIKIDDGVVIELVLIPGGVHLTFDGIGQTDIDGDPPKTILIKPFYMGKYPVTQLQWKTVMGINPSHFRGDTLPVECFHPRTAKDFCCKLSAQSRRNFRLHSIWEWRHACCKDPMQVDLYAWHYHNCGNKTHPVGEKYPNELGLYDMLGNVWEWCIELWRANYTYEISYVTILDNNPLFAVRGGSWSSSSWNLRCANRNAYSMNTRFSTSIGFRIIVEGEK
ncbi:MAG: formylglycine-generating enzyme family protein [bacterium]|nr:formylglycine-generating enzyme family protein [bacterium]